MYKSLLAACLITIILPTTAEAKKLKTKHHPYRKASPGCVQGDCRNGQGTYLFSNGNLYAGGWADGRKSGQGTYFMVDGRNWKNTHKRTGSWARDKMHGRFVYTFPSGSSRTEYWYLDENVTSRLQKCRSAKTLSNTYKGFVALLNAFAAGSNDQDPLEGAARGYDAANRQLLPRAVDLSCGQLLAFAK
ncbi:MAG: hypothetical protein K0U98_04250 [Deltaproteobacteria bacterium]|nr:hypothetical protein [Deltaproteobacteria bacterium]